MTDERFTVEPQPAKGRYALIDHGEDGTGEEVIGGEYYVDVAGEPTERVLFHTIVSEDYAGQGLASRVVQHAVDDVVAQGLAIVPVCPYVARWLPKHPEYEEHVVKPRPEHLAAVQARQKDA